MKDTPRDYTILNELALKLGFRLTPKQGIYLFRNTIAQVDLSACAENEISILKTAVSQLSEEIDENYWYLLEKQQREDFSIMSKTNETNSSQDFDLEYWRKH